MQIFQALEEYMENSKHLPMLPHILKKLIKTHYPTPNNIPKRLETPKVIQHNNLVDFQPAQKRMAQSPFLKDVSNRTTQDLNISNERIQSVPEEKDSACIPIVSNGKWMGVIVTREQNRTPLHITNRTPHIKEPAKDYPAGIEHSKESDSRGPNQSALSEYHVKQVLHEVNTPLSIIKNYMHILGSKLSDQGIAQDEIRIIKEEIDRISKLLGKLNPLPKKTAATIPVNINTQIVDLTKIMREPLEKQSSIKINLNIDEQLPPIFAKTESIKQVLVNLISNGIDAMPDGGHLNIRTRYVRPSVSDEYISNQKPRGRLEIIISDTGMGIPAEIMPQIFDPYISSKNKNHSGMGLSIVQGIVESLHGTITCTNNQTQGATFKITFPIHETSVWCDRIPA